MTKDDVQKLFAYEHLPQELQHVSRPFHDLAMSIVLTIPDHMGAYRTKALNELWQAKNWAVAAMAQK